MEVSGKQNFQDACGKNHKSNTVTLIVILTVTEFSFCIFYISYVLIKLLTENSCYSTEPHLVHGRSGEYCCETIFTTSSMNQMWYYQCVCGQTLGCVSDVICNRANDAIYMVMPWV